MNPPTKDDIESILDKMVQGNDYELWVGYDDWIRGVGVVLADVRVIMRGKMPKRRTLKKWKKRNCYVMYPHERIHYDPETLTFYGLPSRRKIVSLSDMIMCLLGRRIYGG